MKQCRLLFGESRQVFRIQNDMYSFQTKTSLCLHTFDMLCVQLAEFRCRSDPQIYVFQLLVRVVLDGNRLDYVDAVLLQRIVDHRQ